METLIEIGESFGEGTVKSLTIEDRGTGSTIPRSVRRIPDHPASIQGWTGRTERRDDGNVGLPCQSTHDTVSPSSGIRYRGEHRLISI